MIRELSWLDLAYLVLAMRWTILLTLLALTGGGIIGLLVAACGASRRGAWRYFAKGYVSLVQGIPLLAWLFIFFNVMNTELDKLHIKWLGRPMDPMPAL